MKIPRTVTMGLLLSLPIYGAIFLPKHWPPLAGNAGGIMGTVVFLMVQAILTGHAPTLG